MMDQPHVFSFTKNKHVEGTDKIYNKSEKTPEIE